MTLASEAREAADSLTTFKGTGEEVRELRALLRRLAAALEEE